MKETQGALGMLLRRYRLILGKCRLRNALAGLLLGAVLLAPAVSPADSGGKEGRPGHPESSHYTGTTDGASGPYTADGGQSSSPTGPGTWTPARSTAAMPTARVM